MTNDQPKLTVFVSSMIGPLWDERAAVEEAIRTAIPLARTWVFERAPASSEAITESYLARVRECDLYLLILGEDVSDPVKAEYRTAVECDKPRLCFVQEGVEHTEALKEFLPTLQADVMYATFTDGESLQREVLRAVRQELVEGYKRYHLGEADRAQLHPLAGPQMRTVFISHATQDARFAHRLAGDLRRLGVQVWIAPESIRPGEGWVRAIERGLSESSNMVVVLTSAALKSHWVEIETDVAIARERKELIQIIPLDVESCEVPLFLSRYQMVSFRHDYDAGLNQLANVLSVRVTPSLHITPPKPVHRTKPLKVLGAIGAIGMPPIALLLIIGSVFEKPVIAMAVALLVAVLASVWVVRSGLAGIIAIIIAWITLAPAALIIFMFQLTPTEIQSPPPVILRVDPPWTELGAGEQRAIFVESYGEGLRFKWSAERGRLSSSEDRMVVYTAPESAGLDFVLVEVRSSSGTTIHSISFFVYEPTPTATPTNTPSPTNTPALTVTSTPMILHGVVLEQSWLYSSPAEIPGTRAGFLYQSSSIEIVYNYTNESGTEWYYITWKQDEAQGSGWIQADRIRVLGTK